MTQSFPSIKDLDAQALMTEETMVHGPCRLRMDVGMSKRLVIGISENASTEETSEDLTWLRNLCRDLRWSFLWVHLQPDAKSVDRPLAAVLEHILSDKTVQALGPTALCGQGAGGQHVLRIAQRMADIPMVVIMPRSSSAAGRLRKADVTALKARVSDCYVLADPHHKDTKTLKTKLGPTDVAWRHCFGFWDDCVTGLARTRILNSVMSAGLRGEMDAMWFYKTLRLRKNVYVYRKGLEAALLARRQLERAGRIGGLFRQRLKQREASVHRDLAPLMTQGARPTDPIPSQTPPPWPTAPGNVWMLSGDEAGTLRYMSDRWQGRTIGFEERAGVTLAQTPPLALGFASFGHGLNQHRPLPARFPWHVTDSTLSGCGPAQASLAEATAHAHLLEEASEALPSIVALTQSQPAPTVQDIAPEAQGYKALVAQVAGARDVLQAWDKTIYVDRLRVSLLAGAPHLSATEAAAHYAHTIKRLSRDVARAAGQTALPITCVVQGAGTRIDGTSEVILAEGRLDIDLPTQPVIVVSPAYPWPMRLDMPATHTPEADLILDELTAQAVHAVQQGQRWFCPSLQYATCQGDKVIATFACLEGLTLEDGPHGFHLDDGVAACDITDVKVISDTDIELTCAAPPEGDDLSLCYAWGAKRSVESGWSDPHAANRGGLRDCWTQPSRLMPGQTLKRYALSGRVAVMRHM